MMKLTTRLVVMAAFLLLTCVQLTHARPARRQLLEYDMERKITKARPDFAADDDDEVEGPHNPGSLHHHERPRVHSVAPHTEGSPSPADPFRSGDGSGSAHVQKSASGKPLCGPACRQAAVKFLPLDLLDQDIAADPTSVVDDRDLDQVGTFVAPILYGGLGNVLFQLAALLVYSKEVNVPLLVGFVNHWNRQYHTFDPWGGHPAPVHGLTLKHVFPALRWIAYEPKIDARMVINKYAFKIKEPDEYHHMPDASHLPAYIHGYFFNARYWHHKRRHVLDSLKMHPSIDEYIDFVYGDLFQDDHETVSVHLRLGYKGEPAKDLLKDRALPPKAFYARVFGRVFKSDRTRYLIFSDDNDKAKAFMDDFADLGVDYVIIDENVVVSINLMARCKHHLLTSSTLSFWGAYLDPDQPSGGKTILHSTFFRDHGRGMIPDEYASHWVVLDEQHGL